MIVPHWSPVRPPRSGWKRHGREGRSGRSRRSPRNRPSSAPTRSRARRRRVARRSRASPIPRPLPAWPLGVGGRDVGDHRPIGDRPHEGRTRERAARAGITATGRLGGGRLLDRRRGVGKCRPQSASGAARQLESGTRAGAAASQPDRGRSAAAEVGGSSRARHPTTTSARRSRSRRSARAPRAEGPPAGC